MNETRHRDQRTGTAALPRGRRARRWLPMLLACSVLACVSVSLPDAGGQYPEGGVRLPPSNPFPDLDEMDPEMARRQLRALNAARQKEMVRDTAKLLKLAGELDTQTKAEDAATFTEAQWKEIDRIEKLARSVKEKMVMTYGGGPVFQPPDGPPVRLPE